MKKLKPSTIIGKFSNYLFFEALRNGMILAIPVIMTGSFAVMFNNIPIAAYMEFIRIFADGMISNIFVSIASVTLSSMPLILLLTISYSYAELKKFASKEFVPIIVLCAYMVFSLDVEKGLTFEIFQNEWLFLAIVFSISFSTLLIQLSIFFEKKVLKYPRTDNFLLNKALSNIFPALFLLAAALILRKIFLHTLGNTAFQSYIVDYWVLIFTENGRNLSSGLLFAFFNQVLWFFGIHGSNVMDSAAKQVLESGITINAELIAQGLPPTEIVSKSFLDVFVFLGGSGSILCLVIVVFCIIKKMHFKRMPKFAFIPILFNINEIVLFGFPIVLNPIFLIPFIAVPCTLTVVSYAVFALGIIPPISQSVGWTVPIFISGYQATGSLAGSFLQLFNLLLGALLYLPFVLYYKKTLIQTKKIKITELEEYVKECEQVGNIPNFQDMPMANALMNELLYDIKNENVEVFYQPQFDYTSKMIGAEALLRWNIQDVGYIYPPLVIALSELANTADTLDRYILANVCATVEQTKKLTSTPLEFSFNISAMQLKSPFLIDILTDAVENYSLGDNVLCLEITEQAVFQSSQFIIERFEKIRSLGFLLVMDDFGMGHTSLLHLSNHIFDKVKLDGSLIKDMTKNPRCTDIIESIMNLSKTMNFEVVSEYVEKIEQKEQLYALGCTKYQGWLFSKAISQKDFLNLIEVSY